MGGVGKRMRLALATLLVLAVAKDAAPKKGTRAWCDMSVETIRQACQLWEHGNANECNALWDEHYKECPDDELGESASGDAVPRGKQTPWVKLHEPFSKAKLMDLRGGEGYTGLVVLDDGTGAVGCPEGMHPVRVSTKHSSLKEQQEAAKTFFASTNFKLSPPVQVTCKPFHLTDRATSLECIPSEAQMEKDKTVMCIRANAVLSTFAPNGKWSAKWTAFCRLWKVTSCRWFEKGCSDPPCKQCVSQKKVTPVAAAEGIYWTIQSSGILAGSKELFDPAVECTKTGECQPHRAAKDAPTIKEGEHGTWHNATQLARLLKDFHKRRGVTSMCELAAMTE